MKWWRRYVARIRAEEIARIQGVGLNTALARMHYAVLKLRTELKDEYEALRG